LPYVLKYDILHSGGDNMAGAKTIRQILIERDLTIKEFAAMYGIEYQSMRTKLLRDAFTYEEMIKIADMLNCDIKIITRDSKKQF